MDCLDGGFGKSRDFRKDDFEADWVKVPAHGCGLVYRVKVKLWRERCALKCFDSGLTGNGSNRRFLEEVAKMAAVRFKYIVTIYGVCAEPAAVVMEYMTNGSLDNLLASHALMWPKRFQMIHEVAMGMNFLHSLQPPLLHLNLKTSNVLLDDHLHVKISDFGLIKVGEEEEEEEGRKGLMECLTARGNISYIPPEVFKRPTAPPGTPFDVYSFSIVMWETLTQQKPYPGCSVTTVIMKASGGKRPSVERLPEERPRECDQLVSIMEECWDQDPENRPPFSDTVRKTEALSEVLKIPGSHLSNGPHHSLDLTLPRSPTHKVAPPETPPDLPTEESCDGDSVLSLLSQRDFVRFRCSVREEHAARTFHDENSLLHYTVESGDLESVLHVLTLGAGVNSTSRRGYTPLIIATLRRHYEVISALLTHGARTDQGDADGWTALHFAAQGGDPRAVRLLLGGRARADPPEKAGWTPLHLACQNDHEDVARLLLARLETGRLGVREEARGRTPLHLACAYGHHALVRLLLGRGADPDAADRALSTPLHLAAEAGHNRVARELVRAGSEVNREDARRCTPLHLAALQGHAGICRQLLSGGARLDPQTLQGWTPMHLAALRGHTATLVQLESLGCSVNARGESDWTPLHLACHHGRDQAVDRLLACGANPGRAEDGAGWTPLHLASGAGSFPSVLQLLSRGVAVDAVSRRLATPLHLAAQQGSAPVVKALLMNGADRGRRDDAGCSALDLARTAQREEVVRLLMEEEEEG